MDDFELFTEKLTIFLNGYETRALALFGNNASCLLQANKLNINLLLIFACYWILNFKTELCLFLYD